MEFRYDKKHYIGIKRLAPIIILLNTVFYYLIGTIEGRNRIELYEFIGISDFILIIVAVLLYFWFKSRAANLIITITDKGIHFKEREKEKSIDWTNIYEAIWDCGGRGSSAGIVVKTKSENIKIPIEIRDFKIMVKILKKNLGDKFSTTEIPFKYKEFSQ